MPLPARLQRWWPQIQRYAAKYGVPADLMAAVIDFESGGDSNAGHKVSGATGLGQVMPREAGFPGRPTRAELLDPDTNLDWSARILADGYKRWGTPQQAAAAYLGALDRKGNVTGAADANGTTGHAYVAKIMGNLKSFGPLQAGQADQTPSSPRPPVRGGAPGERFWPVVGQKPGAVLNPFGGKQFRSAGAGDLNLPSSNTGADLVATYGQPVVAEMDGQVVEVYQSARDGRTDRGRDAKENFGYGGSVIVQYADGTKARYSHQAAGSIVVKPGQKVTGGQLIGAVGDSGNATGPHVDYMFWDANGTLTDGAKVPHVGGRITVGPQGQPLGPGQSGQAGPVPRGAPTKTQEQIMAVARGLRAPTPEEMARGGVISLQGAGVPSPTAVRAPQAQPRATPNLRPPTPEEVARGGMINLSAPAPAPGAPLTAARDAAFVFGRDEPTPTPWDYKGVPGLRDAALVTGRDEGPGVQPLSDTGATAAAPAQRSATVAPTSPTPTFAQSMQQAQDAARQAAQRGDVEGARRLLVNAGMTAQQAAQALAGMTNAQQTTPAQIQAQGSPNPILGRAIEQAKALLNRGDHPGAVKALTGAGMKLQEALNALRSWVPGAPGAPGGTPPGGGPPGDDQGGATREGSRTEPDTDSPPPPGAGAPEGPGGEHPSNEDRLAAAAAKYGVKETNPPKPGEKLTPKLLDARRKREAANQALIDKGLELEYADFLANQAIPLTPNPGEDGGAFSRRVQELKDAKTLAAERVKVLKAEFSAYRNEVLRNDEQIAAEVQATASGADAKPITTEVDGTTYQWNPETSTWEPAPGLPSSRAGGRKVATEDMGGFTYLYDEETGEYLGKWEKTLGPSEREPKVIGASTGPQLMVYNPATGTVQTIKNPAYEAGKKTAVTAGQDAPYIIREDPVTGALTQEVNPNYNPWSSGNRIEGKGAAEGIVLYVDRDGQQHRIDMLDPAQRKLLEDKAKAKDEGEIAKAQQDKLDLAKKEKEQEELANIDAAIDAGASPAQIRTLVQKAAQNVLDFVNLQNAETSRLTQLETGRHNLAAEEAESRTRRTAEAGEARQGAESYGRWGVNTAPFQTALLGSLSQVTDPRKAAQSMNIDPGVYEPVGVAWDKQQSDLAASAARRATQQTRIDEPYTAPYKPQGGTAGTNPAAPSAGAGANPAAPAGSAGANPAEPAGEAPKGPRQPIPGRDAVDLKDEGKPGWARTYYDDGTSEDWQIPGANTPQAAPTKYYTGNVVPGGSPGEGVGLGGGQTAPMSPSPGPEQMGIGGYFVGGGEYDDHPARGGKAYFHPMYVPRWAPGGASPANPGGGGGGGEQGGQPQQSEGGNRRRRLPVPGKHVQFLGDGWARTEYDDGALEDWHLSDGSAWEGVGGGGAGYWGEEPPSLWQTEGVGGGGSLWTLPPSPSVDAGYGAQTVMTQGQQGVLPPSGAGPPEQPAGVAGGFGGPAPKGGSPGGGGGQFGQNMAPMWDSASPAPFMSSGVGGPSGAAGQATLYRSGASGGGGSPGGQPFNPQRAMDPPKHSGSYYGGPGAPQANTPLQRLLQQTGVIPMSAGRASGSPGTV